MKQIKQIVAIAVLALMLVSCNKYNYKSFVGTWGVEKIEYYNIDYLGQPIAATLVSYSFDPDNVDDGIQLIFREDKTGEMRDSNVDTILCDFNEETGEYESYIVNPDTTVVYPFTCSFDESEHVLYMNMVYETDLKTFKMQIENLTTNSFMYENEYHKDYVEKAYMKRLSKTPSKSADKSNVKRSHKMGSFLSGR